MSRSHAEPGTPRTRLPLEGRTTSLEFDTDEGTWMSVDVTPDGATLVFDLLGGLYAMPVAGGDVECLTEGLAYDAQPRVSPDGRWIAFISDRNGADNLWVLDRSTADLRRLSDNQHTISISPTWTPDGKDIVVAECLSYLSEATFRRYPLSGQAGQDIVDAKSVPVRGAGGVVSPDGRYLYFSRRDPDDQRRYLMPVAQLRRLDLRRGTVEVLTRGRGGGTRPLLSPDGRLLVYATRHETLTALRVRDLVTGRDRCLVRPVQQDRQDYGRALRGDHLPGYAFTPDGSHLMLAHGGKIHRVALQDGTSRAVPFHVHVAREIGPRLHRTVRVEQGPVTARVAHTPSWSGDGRHVAASVLTRIYVQDVGADATPRRLTRSRQTELQPVWSPDGRWVTYLVWSPVRRGHIWSAPTDRKGAPRRLTRLSAFYTDLAYSPDGTRIFAMRGVDPDTGTFSDTLPDVLDLVCIPSDGGAVQVVDFCHPGRYPHFGSDPSRVYTTDGHSLLSIRVDGTDRRTHLTVTGRAYGEENGQPAAERILVSPRGAQALALVNKQLWMLPVPSTDAPPLHLDLRAPGGTARRLTEVGADYFGWGQGGEKIFWAVGSTIYRSACDERSTPLERSVGTETHRVTVRRPRAGTSGAALLRGGTVLAMADGGTASASRADVLVDGNRITHVGPGGSVPVPEGARIIDVSGRILLPGFIDTHAHWSYPSPEVADPDSWSLRASLAYGVTAGLDVQSDHVANFVYQDLVETGRTVGPRAFLVGPAIFGVNNYKPFEADFQSYEEALSYLRRYQEHYRVHAVKLYLSGNRRQRQWLALACQQLGLVPTTEGFGDLGLHVTHALDGMRGNEHAVTDSTLHDDVLQTFARTVTSHTSTLTATHYGLPGVEYFLSRVDVQDDAKLNLHYPRDVLVELTARRRAWRHAKEFSIGVMAAQAARIHRAGGLVGVGSHGELQGLGYHWEMEMLAMGGMTPSEILTCATRDGARIIGLEADLGTIEPGKLADILVLTADPRADIRNTTSIAYVMKDGVLYDGTTLAVVDERYVVS